VTLRPLLAAVLLAGCSGGGGGAGDDADAAAGGFDAGDGDGAAADAPPGSDAPGGGPQTVVLYQCDAFSGGLCVMHVDGSGSVTLYGSGFAPRGLDDGSILFHTAAYRVARRTAGGTIQDLGDGAFPRPYPGGRILFQCSGLGGGLCLMDADGGNRSSLRAQGRVPDVDAGGVILFHSDAYRVIRREPSGDETDLGDGAFAEWTDNGRVVFQCSGLDGGLCRMAGDGSQRQTLEASGRVPDPDAAGDILFHSDAYTVSLRTAGGVSPLHAGANAVWWTRP